MALDPELMKLLETTRAPMSIADATADDCPLLAVNHEFEVLTGYRKTEVLGRNCRFLQNGDDQSDQREILRSAIRDRTEAQVVLRNTRKNQESFLNLLFLFPIFDGQVCKFFLGSQFALEGPDLERHTSERADYLTRALDRIKSQRQVLLKEKRKIISDAAASTVRSYFSRLK
ncbi:MAG: PAS domain-containing protein [Pseudomonadota bacterium]